MSSYIYLPFDPRFKDVTRNGRPPSLITFAVPDNEPGSDQSSDEEDDEWDPVSKRLQTPHRQQKQDQVPQTTTHTYTLLCFSTCQILEENCEITWYVTSHMNFISKCVKRI